MNNKFKKFNKFKVIPKKWEIKNEIDNIYVNSNFEGGYDVDEGSLEGAPDFHLWSGASTTVNYYQEGYGRKIVLNEGGEGTNRALSYRVDDNNTELKKGDVCKISYDVKSTESSSVLSSIGVSNVGVRGITNHGNVGEWGEVYSYFEILEDDWYISYRVGNTGTSRSPIVEIRNPVLKKLDIDFAPGAKSKMLVGQDGDNKGFIRGSIGELIPDDEMIVNLVVAGSSLELAIDGPDVGQGTIAIVRFPGYSSEELILIRQSNDTWRRINMGELGDWLSDREGSLVDVEYTLFVEVNYSK